MIQVTQLQRDNALYALNEMWPDIESDHTRLDRWCHVSHGCGTFYCFGGRCAFDPRFMAQGAEASRYGGEPIIFDERGQVTARGRGVATILFGDRRLFYTRGEEIYDNREENIDDKLGGNDPSVSDHELVKRRLQWLIDNSEVVA